MQIKPWLEKILISIQNIRLNRQMLMFVFFFIISSIAWFLTALDKDYVHSIVHPVEFTNLPNELAVADSLPSELTLTVNARGYSLVRNAFGGKPQPLKIEVNKLVFGSLIKNKQLIKYVTGLQLIKYFSENYSGKFKIVGVLPDTIAFRKINVRSKKVKVKPQLTVNYRRQFMEATETITVPDSVVLTGPRHLIDTMQFIHTESLVFDDLNGVKRQNAKLLFPKSIVGKILQVEVIAESTQFTEFTIDIEITCNGLPENANFIAFPNKITVKGNIPLENFAELHTKWFIAHVDYSDIQAGTSQSAVKLDILLKYAKNVSFSPQLIECIIEQ
ncbi:MAG TPA: hypothetical protein DCQ31_05110 [Bacteroidales bacterium]|nr:hypothetical protein [Bacteroidales bacterium]